MTVQWFLIFIFPAYVGPDHTQLEAKNGVRIVSTESNKTVLHIAEREVVWDVPAAAKDLDTTHVISHRVRITVILSREYQMLAPNFNGGC